MLRYALALRASRYAPEEVLRGQLDVVVSYDNVPLFINTGSLYFHLTNSFHC